MNHCETNPDFLVIGAGVVGISIARELAARHPDCRVTVLEKEPDIGAHASGRNSGVIHAGFYYTADSLKARFTRDGNRALKEFCAGRKLRIRNCGKLVVAKNEEEVPVLETLLERGRQNGVELARVTPRQARAIEPRVKTCGAALFSPTTASIDPLEVLRAMADAAREAGVAIHAGVRYRGRDGSAVRTDKGVYTPGYVVNAAGLYADTIAKDFGFSKRYHLLPFKGLYLYAAPDAPPLATNVYPVPNLANPFLGVHFTVTVGGRVKIGPTAIPCFWREQYGWLKNFAFGELREIVGGEIALFSGADFDFRRLAVEELRKQFRPHIVGLAAALVSGVRVADYRKWGRPGIRAQLVDAKKRRLVMDFVIEHGSRSLHVLNAVSPAFTCSIPFARHVADLIDGAA